MREATEQQIERIRELQNALREQVKTTGDVDQTMSKELNQLMRQTGYAEEIDLDE